MQLKSYTDLEQSKKLIEILPLESADMYYEEVCNLPKVIVGNYILHNQCMEDKDYKKLSNPVLSPAWSLSALLDVLPNNKHIATTLLKGVWKIEPIEYIDKWFCEYEDRVEKDIPCKDLSVSADNPIDACYEMIIKLHEMNLL